MVCLALWSLEWLVKKRDYGHCVCEDGFHLHKLKNRPMPVLELWQVASSVPSRYSLLFGKEEQDDRLSIVSLSFSSKYIQITK